MRPLVLIVDDDADTRDAAREFLEDEGYAVDVARDGHAALARLARSPVPGMMLLDLGMPGMDGHTLVGVLETSSNLSRIPLVLMTASTATEKTSALPYPLLRKPVDGQALLQMVAQYCPRDWEDDEPATDEVALMGDAPVSSSTARSGETTKKELCAACGLRAATRCRACGESFCRACLDAGFEGQCAPCWQRSRQRC